MHDGTRAIGGIRALIVDVGFITIAIGNGAAVLAAQVDAAVGIVTGPELDPQLKITVILPGHEKGGTTGTFGGLDGTVRGRPVGLPETVEIFHAAGAIDQGGPVLRGAGGGRQQGGQKDEI
ncbi:MAG: hypothetical protein RLZZ385_296 [Pseudomonadota bacterium]